MIRFPLCYLKSNKYVKSNEEGYFLKKNGYIYIEVTRGSYIFNIVLKYVKNDYILISKTKTKILKNNKNILKTIKDLFLIFFNFIKNIRHF